jgi:hypothetical protein
MADLGFAAAFLRPGSGKEAHGEHGSEHHQDERTGDRYGAHQQLDQIVETHQHEPRHPVAASIVAASFNQMPPRRPE